MSCSQQFDDWYDDDWDSWEFDRFGYNDYPADEPDPPKGHAAIVICERPDGMLLVVTRGASPDVGAPGGVVEPNEGPPETARRELEEETGLEVEVSALRYLTSIVNEDDWLLEVYVLDYSRIADQQLIRSEEGAPIWTTWDRTFAGPWGKTGYQIYNLSHPIPN